MGKSERWCIIDLEEGLEQYTKPGDNVFEPFAGLGSTLFVAEQLGRSAYGIESDVRRFRWIRNRLIAPERILHGDSAQLLKYEFPRMDFSFTSPPYMPKHHQWNPLCPSDPSKKGYQQYLRQLQNIYQALHQLMKRGAYIVIQADNLANKVYTPLAWDIAQVVAEVFRFEGETVIALSDNTGQYEHTYCFTFKKI